MLGNEKMLLQYSKIEYCTQNQHALPIEAGKCVTIGLAKPSPQVIIENALKPTSRMGEAKMASPKSKCKTTNLIIADFASYSPTLPVYPEKAQCVPV